MDHRRQRQYWLWVTRPDYYMEFDDSEVERECLDPEICPDVQGWWTCHQKTQLGDLILLYRTLPKKDIAYLIEAKSDAYSIPPVERDFSNWHWGCDFLVLEKFAVPLPRSVLMDDPVLSNWGVMTSGPQGQVFSIPPSVWNRLLALTEERQPAKKVAREASEPLVEIAARPDEAWLEDALVDRPALLKGAGFRVRKSDVKRQVYCDGISGRLDLLCRTADGCLLVVELKARSAKLQDISQIASYVSWVEDAFAEPDELVTGLLIAPDFPEKTRAAVRQMPALEIATWTGSGADLAIAGLQFA